LHQEAGPLCILYYSHTHILTVSTMALDELTAPGFVNNLTPQQKDILAEFQARLMEWKNEHTEEASMELAGIVDVESYNLNVIYCKFLRARQFKLEDSFTLYTDFLIWKNTFQGIGVPNITVPSVINEINTGKCISFGRCHLGRPIIWIRFYLHKKSKTDPAEAERFIAWFFDNARHIPRAKGIETTTVVIDLSNIGRDNMDLTVAKQWGNMLGTKYPECLGQGLLLNAPWIFSAFWSLLTPVLDPRTTKKLKFINQDKLTDYMSKETILKQYGGEGEYVLEDDPVYSRAALGSGSS